MSKKLYLYLFDMPSVKIAWGIFGVLFASLALFSPGESLPVRLLAALCIGILPFLLSYLQLYYWYIANNKRANVRFIKLDDKNLEIILRNKTVKICPVEKIDSVSISYKGYLGTLRGAFPLSRQEEISVGINVSDSDNSEFQSLEFSTVVWPAVIGFVKYAKNKSISVVYNSDETKNYFEKICG